MAISASDSAVELQTELGNSNSPEKEIGKLGLKKRVLTQGKSWQTPANGDEVEVHFSGKIRGGSLLDSSRDRDAPFRFRLGQGEVIGGWDAGVATMKKGERAVFTVPPKMAYGEAGSPPLVPPNSTLVFDIELISWNVVRDVTGDGGVLKKIVRDGEGWATPRDGDEALVKCEATLENGKVVFDSDGDEFIITDDYVCPAISRAVKTMRRGEKAELEVKFAYGHREFESEGCVSPGSVLTIKLELISWKSVVPITKNGTLVKKIINPGEGFDYPEEGSIVKVAYICKLEDGSEIEHKGSEDEPYEFTCLEGQVNGGFERAVMTMKRGERAMVTVGAEYLSSLDDYAGSAVHYHVWLIDFAKEKPYWKMNTSEKIEACKKKKHEGNISFKDGKFWRASKKYEKAAKCVEFDHSFTDDEKKLAESLRLSCHLNNAACKLRLEATLEAAKLCSMVLEVDPLNIKALFRRSQAYLRLSELEKADQDISTALRIDPNNRDVKMAQKELKDMQREYVKYQSQIFSSMLSKMAN